MNNQISINKIPTQFPQYPTENSQLIVDTHPLQIKPALCHLIPELAAIVLDYCPNRLWASVFNSQVWYDNLAKELQEGIKPIAATINLKPDILNNEQYCISIARHVNKFVEKAKFLVEDRDFCVLHLPQHILNAQSKTIDLEELDVWPRIKLIQHFIDYDLYTIFLKVFSKMKPLTDEMLQCFDGVDITIKAKRIREYLEAHNKDFIKIDSLDISNCKLNSLPFEICYLSNLKHLDLFHNYLQYLPEYIINLNRINYLQLALNQLQEIPECIGQLTQLSYLNVNKNQIAFLPESIGQLKKVLEPNQQIYPAFYFDYNPLQRLPDFYKERFKNKKWLAHCFESREIQKLVDELIKEIKAERPKQKCILM